MRWKNRNYINNTDYKKLYNTDGSFQDVMAYLRFTSPTTRWE